MDLRIILLLLTVASCLALATTRRAWRGRRRAGSGAPDPATIYVRNPEARAAISQGEHLLSLPRQREGLALNAVATRCWELMDGTRTLGAIADDVAREYGVTPSTALAEVRRFAGRLRQGLYALEDWEWTVAHTHFSDIFAGARDRGVSELRREGVILHAATAALGADGSLDTPRLRPPWSLKRRRAQAAFARHVEGERDRREAVRIFDEAWDHSGAGRLGDAERGFLEASRLVPGWANPHYQLGYVHLRGGAYARAVEEFSRADQLSPGYYMVREYLALARRLAEGRLSLEAFHLFERATSLEPRDPDAAIKLCLRALELSPEFPAASLLIGRAWARKREYEKALAALRQAISSDPDRATLCNALFARGSVFMETGRAEQALREFEKVIELDGSPAATRSAMAHLASSGSVH